MNNNYLVIVKNQIIDTENGIYKYFDNKLTRELTLDNEQVVRSVFAGLMLLKWHDE